MPAIVEQQVGSVRIFVSPGKSVEIVTKLRDLKLLDRARIGVEDNQINVAVTYQFDQKQRPSLSDILRLVSSKELSAEISSLILGIVAFGNAGDPLPLHMVQSARTYPTYNELAGSASKDGGGDTPADTETNADDQAT